MATKIRHMQLTIIQRERALIRLIEDAEKLEFNDVLITEYKKQLSHVQEIIKADKIKRKSYLIERRLS